VFCSVREPVAKPLCDFYAAAFTKLLSMFDVAARTEVLACRGTGEATCVMRVSTAEPVEANAEATEKTISTRRNGATEKRTEKRTDKTTENTTEKTS
jgi:hypothetical protein